MTLTAIRNGDGDDDDGAVIQMFDFMHRMRYDI